MPKENYMKICSENEKWDNIIANFCFSLWEKMWMKKCRHTQKIQSNSFVGCRFREKYNWDFSALTGFVK